MQLPVQIWLPRHWSEQCPYALVIGGSLKSATLFGCIKHLDTLAVRLSKKSIFYESFNSEFKYAIRFYCASIVAPLTLCVRLAHAQGSVPKSAKI